MQKIMSSLITDVEKLLYQAAGVNVQLYSQDTIKMHLQHAFDHCFTAKFWPSFTRREIRTLDGVTGKVSAPFSLVTQWKDVQSVFRKNSSHPIPTLPLSFNLLDLPDGTIMKFLEPTNDAYLFTAYPIGATDQLVVVGRERPIAEFIETETVPFDSLALEYFAAWAYLVDDASNAGAAAKMQGLFDSRMKALEDSEFSNIVPLNPRSSEIPANWY